MSKKTHTWRQRAVNAKTGPQPVTLIVRPKPARPKHPDPAWLLPTLMSSMKQQVVSEQPQEVAMA